MGPEMAASCSALCSQDALAFFLEFTLCLLYHIPHCCLHVRIAAPSSFPTKVFASSFHLAFFIAILFFPIFQLVYFLTIMKVDAKTVSWFGLPSAERWEKKSSLQPAQVIAIAAGKGRNCSQILRFKKEKKKQERKRGKTPFFQPSYLRGNCCNFVSPQSSHQASLLGKADF